GTAEPDCRALEQVGQTLEATIVIRTHLLGSQALLGDLGVLLRQAPLQPRDPSLRPLRSSVHPIAIAGQPRSLAHHDLDVDAAERLHPERARDPRDAVPRLDRAPRLFERGRAEPLYFGRNRILAPRASKAEHLGHPSDGALGQSSLAL